MTETRGGPPVDYADDSVFAAGDSVSPGVKEATFADFKAWLLAGIAAYPSFIGHAGDVLAVNALEDDVEWVTGGGGGGGGGAVGSHRYWRIYAIGTSSATQAVACAELRFRSTPGGSNLAVTSSYCVEENGSYPSSNLYNGNLSDLWGVSAAASTPFCSLVFDLGSAVAVEEIMIAARNDSFYGQAPRSFTLAWSDDGIVFHDVASFELGAYTVAGAQKLAAVPTTYP